MTKQIIVTYRLPVSKRDHKGSTLLQASSGGLVTAISSLQKNMGQGNHMWVGCADFSRTDWNHHRDEVKSDFILHPVFLEKSLNRKFYNGFSNSVLWPLFHYFTSYVEFHTSYFEAYTKANEEICQALLPLINPGDTVWIHDYHLLLLPEMLRKACPDVRIGFFLHIPFPDYEIFRLIPGYCRLQLLKGMMGADLLGFHTYDYNIHFLSNIHLHLGLQHRSFELQWNGRKIKSNVFPVGIDFDKFNNGYALPKVCKERLKLRAMYAGKKIIFSVDRLDYTKGVVHRLNGFKAFLEKYPEWHERVIFILSVVPSRSEIQKYGERKQLIEQAISHINGTYGNFKWTPIVYQYTNLDFEDLVSLYTSCDIALISPIRDGMNLVAKEFIASRQDKQGVLMLSNMTGAAKELGSAVLFNPLDEKEIAEKLNQSLYLTPQDQGVMLSHLQERVKKYDVFHWAHHFTSQLTQMSGTGITSNLLDMPTRKILLNHFKKAPQRLIMLDYDGTLMPFFPRPEQARPSVELKALLRHIAANPLNKVVIISGRDPDTLEDWLGDLPIDLVAEHGAYLRQGRWIKAIEHQNSWKKQVLAIMQDFIDRCPNSFIEEKNSSLAWHYRNTDNEGGMSISRELLRVLRHFLYNTQITVLDGNKVIEVRPVNINKGVVYQRYYAAGGHMTMAIGDDRTDEDLFEAVNRDTGYTIKVGPQGTCARYRLDSVPQVISLLGQLD